MVGKSMFIVVSIQNTELILKLLFIHYCIIFHMKIYKSTFAHPCILCWWYISIWTSHILSADIIQIVTIIGDSMLVVSEERTEKLIVCCIMEENWDFSNHVCSGPMQSKIPVCINWLKGRGKQNHHDSLFLSAYG